ncbi:MAG: Asp23/Gls24 family envelope stress response protein [Candidatus Dormibacteraeota bacterium]|nr:Asp23/Gls24 family envelope stress response protein [Candidatus Dormibacteraeota bacterium]MBV9524317.1 Asp23/Gls24 family envelope stress response protein [Candidatus Dormibacteraeota bacterium]
MDTATRPPLQLGDGGGGRAPLGTTRVANEVVAHIAALAALQVKDVHALYHPGATIPIDRVRRQPSSRGVRVELHDDSLRIDLWIAMEAGGNVPAVGAEVQRRVADAIDRMLDLRASEVNVFVSEIVFT